ncbi:MAG TPA: hypothetical protein VGM25_09630 [Caulobacteraceae bacterium]|jgi:hypothetical protein
MAGGLRAFLARYFYIAMAVLLATVAWYGFSHTIDENLFHGSFPRPRVLFVHAAVFGGWMVLLVVQTGLVALFRKRRWHRWLGWLGVAMACAMPVLGTWSAIRMTHLRFGFGDIDDVAFLILAFNDMAAFAVLMAAAVLLRNRDSEAHKRLVLMATTLICVAALTRFPPWLPAAEHGVWPYYLYADVLVALGLGRDLVVLRRPHWVYVRVFPAMIAIQAIANVVYMMRPRAWMDFALLLIR